MSQAANNDNNNRPERGRIGLVEAVAIGIGGMVGGGIFSVLGLTVQVAGGGAWVSFSSADSWRLSQPILTPNSRSATLRAEAPRRF